MRQDDRSLRPVILMRTVQSSEAKAKFAELLTAVERGETIVITRRGETIAHIVPAPALREREIDEAIASIKRLQKKNGRITVKEILAARDAARKY